MLTCFRVCSDSCFRHFYHSNIMIPFSLRLFAADVFSLIKNVFTSFFGTFFLLHVGLLLTSSCVFTDLCFLHFFTATLLFPLCICLLLTCFRIKNVFVSFFDTFSFSLCRLLLTASREFQLFFLCLYSPLRNNLYISFYISLPWPCFRSFW